MSICRLTYYPIICTGEFDCSFSTYNGIIPDAAFAGLSQLSYLDIADNGYTTSIPSSITNLPELDTFYLENCFLKGDLSFMIGMPKIFELWMDGTVLETTTIPTEIGLLKTLTSWSLSFCELEGTIPTQLGQLTTLDRMWLYQNKLTGTIPTELGNLSRMLYFHVEGNLLAGSMPTEICANKPPTGLIEELGSDCGDTGNVVCSCCTCCGGTACGNFNP